MEEVLSNVDLSLCVVRQLPVHPRCFALAGSTGRAMAAVVKAEREELAKQVCKELRLVRVRGEAAGRKLFQLVESGQTRPVLRLVVAGAPLELKNRFGITALMLAAEEGHSEMVLALIEARAGLDMQDEDGKTALMRAARNGHAQIVTALINARAGLDLLQDHGGSALMVAAIEGQTEIALGLIGAGADLDMQHEYGNTALMRAADKGHTEERKKWARREASASTFPGNDSQTP